MSQRFGSWVLTANKKDWEVVECDSVHAATCKSAGVRERKEKAVQGGKRPAGEWRLLVKLTTAVVVAWQMDPAQAV